MHSATASWSHHNDVPESCFLLLLGCSIDEGTQWPSIRAATSSERCASHLFPLHRYMYDGELEAQMCMIFDANKHLISTADIYPEVRGLLFGGMHLRLLSWSLPLADGFVPICITSCLWSVRLLQKCPFGQHDFQLFQQATFDIPRPTIFPLNALAGLAPVCMQTCER